MKQTFEAILKRGKDKPLWSIEMPWNCFGGALVKRGTRFKKRHFGINSASASCDDERYEDEDENEDKEKL